MKIAFSQSVDSPESSFFVLEFLDFRMFDASLFSDAPERRVICDRCRRPQKNACICSTLPSKTVYTPHFHTIIIQHPLELTKPLNSVQLFPLILNDFTIHLIRRRKNDNDASMDKVLTEARQRHDHVVLLYPPTKHDPSVEFREYLNSNVTQDQSVAIVALDASWQYSQNMYHRFKEQLRPLPKVYLCPSQASIYVKIEPSSQHVSTLEAIALSLNDFYHHRQEQNEASHTLMQAFTKFNAIQRYYQHQSDSEKPASSQ